MLPPNLISALQTLTKAGNNPNTVTNNAPNPAAKLEIGQQFQGTVQSKVSEGMFKVQVAGQTLQMRLPGNMQSGDVIRLVVVSTQPRITFSMAASTNPLSTPEEIGSSARMLSDLAGSPLEHPVVQQLGSKAVWQTEQTVPDAKSLAGALRETLGKSGLFYESHQAQWVRGERSTNQLLAEPQNILTGRNLLQPSAVVPRSMLNDDSLSGPTIPQESNAPAVQAGSAATETRTGQPSASGSDAALPVARELTRNNSAPGTADAQKLKLPPRQAGSPAPDNKAEQSAATGSNTLPVGKELLQLVQQQLHTLENHHLVWQGQIWPGQQMQWEIQGEPEHQATEQDERQWSTEIELDLPRLGGVHARLIFAGSGMRLTLHAADPATAELFKRSLPALKDTLAAADIPLLAAVVEKS
ncbi:MAG: flagellar hook-length control protein FliK [Gallionella sp.]